MQEDARLDWRAAWLEPVMNALTSRDERLSSSVAAYALPVVLTIEPASLLSLLDALLHQQGLPGSPEGMEDGQVGGSCGPLPSMALKLETVIEGASQTCSIASGLWTSPSMHGWARHSRGRVVHGRDQSTSRPC